MSDLESMPLDDQAPEKGYVTFELKRAREQLGWSLDLVAERLNLSIEQIEKLESLEKEVGELSPYERGYVRNYAQLVGLDLMAYEAKFPDGGTIASDIHSVEKYSYQVSKPFISTLWAKLVIYSLVAMVLIGVLMTVNLDLFN